MVPIRCPLNRARGERNQGWGGGKRSGTWDEGNMNIRNEIRSESSKESVETCLVQHLCKGSFCFCSASLLFFCQFNRIGSSSWVIESCRHRRRPKESICCPALPRWRVTQSGSFIRPIINVGRGVIGLFRINVSLGDARDSISNRPPALPPLLVLLLGDTERGMARRAVGGVMARCGKPENSHGQWAGVYNCAKNTRQNGWLFVSLST